MKISWKASVRKLSIFIPILVANLFAVAGALVAAITLISMLASRALRHWLKLHPSLIFVSLIISVLIISILLNYIRTSRQEGTQSSVNNHDADLLGHFIAVLPPDGVTITWMRQDFDPAALPRESLQALIEAIRRLRLNPVGYDDRIARGAYTHLDNAIENFFQEALKWAQLDPRGNFYTIPDEWKYEQRTKYETAVLEIQKRHTIMLVAYDNFLQVCHEQNIGVLGQ